MVVQLFIGFFVGVWIAVVPAAMLAQGTSAGRTLRLEVDNDLFALRGSGKPADYDYTHGTQLGVDLERAPWWVRRLSGSTSIPACETSGDSARECTTATVGLGQDIYTPRHDTLVPIQGERPYAGWLFASAAARRLSGSNSHERVRTLSGALGMVGPLSLAANVQNGIHQLLDNHLQLGWAHQLATEPGVVLTYDDAQVSDHAPGTVLKRALGQKINARTSLYFGGAVGNVLTGLHAGGRGWIGIPEFKSTSIAPERDPPMRLYLLGGVRGDLVLHTIFLDGNTFVPSVRAVRRPVVWESELGLGVRRSRLSAEYRFVTRGLEYRGEPSPHSYGAITLAVHGI